MAKKKAFGGVLDEPLEPLLIGLLMRDAERDELIRKRLDAESKKLHLLLEYYALEAEDYHSLALELSREFVTGFQEKVVQGRPKKWDDKVLGYLFVDVERAKLELAEQDHDMNKVYYSVAMLPRWVSFFDHVVNATNRDADPAEIVRKQYLEAKSIAWSEVAWDAFEWARYQKKIAEWDEAVDANVKKHTDISRN